MFYAIFLILFTCYQQYHGNADYVRTPHPNTKNQYIAKVSEIFDSLNGEPMADDYRRAANPNAKKNATNSTLTTEQRTINWHMMQAIYGAKYSLSLMNVNRKKYQERGEYQLGFIYSQMRFLRIKIQDLYSTAYYLIRQGAYTTMQNKYLSLLTNEEKLAFGMKLYEKISRLEVDIAMSYDVFVQLEAMLAIVNKS